MRDEPKPSPSASSSTSSSTSSSASSASPEDPHEGKRHLTYGIGIGLMGVAGAAVGALCPLCVVACPAFLASGAWKTYKAKRRADGEQAAQDLDADQADGDPSPC